MDDRNEECIQNVGQKVQKISLFFLQLDFESNKSLRLFWRPAGGQLAHSR
jgi:hypothetical protein